MFSVDLVVCVILHRDPRVPAMTLTSLRGVSVCFWYRYNAKVHPHIPKLQELLRGLADRAGLTPKVVVSPNASHAGDRSAWDPAWIPFDEFVQSGKQRKLGRTAAGEIEWARLGFDWPLWILFSSGTTGACCRQADTAYLFYEARDAHG